MIYYILVFEFLFEFTVNIIINPISKLIVKQINATKNPMKYLHLYGKC